VLRCVIAIYFEQWLSACYLLRGSSSTVASAISIFPIPVNFRIVPSQRNLTSYVRAHTGSIPVPRTMLHRNLPRIGRPVVPSWGRGSFYGAVGSSSNSLLCPASPCDGLFHGRMPHRRYPCLCPKDAEAACFTAVPRTHRRLNAATCSNALSPRA
jgi:hypothetical protein